MKPLPSSQGREIAVISIIFLELQYVRQPPCIVTSFLIQCNPQWHGIEVRMSSCAADFIWVPKNVIFCSRFYTNSRSIMVCKETQVWCSSYTATARWWNCWVFLWNGEASHWSARSMAQAKWEGWCHWKFGSCIKSRSYVYDTISFLLCMWTSHSWLYNGSILYGKFKQNHEKLWKCTTWLCKLSARWISVSST